MKSDREPNSMRPRAPGWYGTVFKDDFVNCTCLWLQEVGGDMRACEDLRKPLATEKYGEVSTSACGVFRGTRNIWGSAWELATFSFPAYLIALEEMLAEPLWDNHSVEDYSH
jgi:hypothetical protein